MNRALLALSFLSLAACQSTSIRTYGSPEEATQAIVAAAEAGDTVEASRIFDTFARSSVQRDRVYAQLFDAGQTRYEDGRAAQAADVFGFVCDRYPGAVAAKESLVFALFLERAELGQADPELTKALETAVDDVLAVSQTPSAWVDLAATQAAVDAGDMGRARDVFSVFLGKWDGAPSSLMVYVEDLDRRLRSE